MPFGHRSEAAAALIEHLNIILILQCLYVEFISFLLFSCLEIRLIILITTNFFPEQKSFFKILYKCFQVLGLASSCIFIECMGIPCCLFVVVKETPQFSTQGLHSSFLIALRSFICAMNKKCILRPRQCSAFCGGGAPPRRDTFMVRGATGVKEKGIKCSSVLF